MPMELRLTDHPERLDIYDETGHIGSIWYAEPDEDDSTEGWTAELWGFRSGWHPTTGFLPTAAEAFAAVWPWYEQLIEERESIARFHRGRWTRVISIPMGGQPPR